jgi:O-antigen/teichoic acid export membrane protein
MAWVLAAFRRQQRAMNARLSPGKDSVTTLTSKPASGSSSGVRVLPPVLGRLLSGTFWLALRTPLQVVLAFWSVRLVLQAIGRDANGAYQFAWGFGFIQFVIEFGMSSALQRQVAETWTKGDRGGVDRAIACGMTFYAGVALVQIAALLAVAHLVMPRYAEVWGDSYPLIIKLLWLQAVTAPCYGLSMVVSSVLQAARRYDFIPRLELLIVVVRFLILAIGLSLLGPKFFFLVVVTQTAAQVVLSLGPALWVMVRELGHVPHFRGAMRADYAALLHISFYTSLIQLSVVLADKIDTTILGFAMDEPGAANTVYKLVSTPFLQIRQAGWALAYFVMPAVASLWAAQDERGLERIKYDGPRLHLAVLLPVALLAWIYAGPFLSLWVGDQLGPAAEEAAPLLRLFLIAALPIVIAVQVQMAIGMNRIEVIALAALAGSLVNVPISYVLTRRLGVAGVIWGSVLTTLFSNLLIPGIHVFRILKIRPGTYLRRTLGAPLAGAALLVPVTWICRLIFPTTWEGSTVLLRSLPLLGHLTLGCLAFLAGYVLVPTGRADLAALVRKIRRPAPVSLAAVES